jgi:hypothetical protein
LYRHVLDSGTIGTGIELSANEDACGEADLALETLGVELVSKGGGCHCWEMGDYDGPMAEKGRLYRLMAPLYVMRRIGRDEVRRRPQPRDRLGRQWRNQHPRFGLATH